MCNCNECQLLMELDSVGDSLFYADFIGSGPISFYKYEEDEEKELAYQRGMKAGLIFKYNEIQGYRYLG